MQLSKNGYGKAMMAQYIFRGMNVCGTVEYGECGKIKLKLANIQYVHHDMEYMHSVMYSVYKGLAVYRHVFE